MVADTPGAMPPAWTSGWQQCTLSQHIKASRTGPNLRVENLSTGFGILVLSLTVYMALGQSPNVPELLSAYL